MADQRTITWKANVEFVGKTEEFVQFVEALSAAHAKIDLGAIKKLEPSPGYVAPRYMGTPEIWKVLNDETVHRIPGRINGGIRTPHFHMGKEIFLVDRDQFKTILGEVARDVFEHRALQHEDCMEVITPLAEIG
jgi:hypothetical protein